MTWITNVLVNRKVVDGGGSGGDFSGGGNGGWKRGLAIGLELGLVESDNLYCRW